MKARIDWAQLAPEALKAVMTLDGYVQRSGLEPILLDLVRMRASQINGCAFCLYKHSRDARRIGETEERLYLLDAWRESPLYSQRERAALAWTEAVTRVSETHVPDAVFAEARQHFSDPELVDLTLAVATINVLNRIAISFRLVHPTHAGREAAPPVGAPAAAS
jgi:AhpD family alkylhydroperoxidase